MSLKKIIVIPIIMLMITGSLNAAFAVSARSGPYEIDLSTEPAIVPVGKAQLIIQIQSQGKPVTGADVKALAQMPGMPMGEREAQAVPRSGQPGTYVAPAGFAMQGTYQVNLDIDGPSGKTSLKIPLQTGQNTAQSGGLPWLTIVISVLLLAALAYVIYRMKSTGQHIPLKKVLGPSTLVGIAVLVVLFLLALYAVRHWRRAGAMTPVEEMGMSMEMPAPAGALPVQLATVTRGDVSDQVVYSGQAVGYVEQDIYPRVSGIIEWMPFYAGDKIKKGQLLARLDTSQYDPQVAAQRAAASQARQQVGIAQSENSAAKAQANQAIAQTGAQSNMMAQAQHLVDQAKAIIRQKQSTLQAAQSQTSKMRSDLQEAQNNYQASLATRSQAQSDVNVAQQAQSAAQANAAAAKTRIDDAQADVDYWNVEIPRMKVLLQGGAVSQQTYESELAQSKRATAKVEDAKAQLQQAQADARVAAAKIQSAQAFAASAAAQSAASKSRIAKAQASIQKADAQAQAARADVDQARGAAKAAISQVAAARSTLLAQREAANAAQSNASAANGRIGAAVAGANQAQAQLSSAEINKGYTLIRSQVNGVVTRRLISPGVLVQPGQAILQVAQINPIRLQANVAEQDLARIHVETPVTVSLADGNAKPVMAKVTSIMPSVDASSHTGVVEAVVNNPTDQFLPGQYVKMAISVGQTKNAMQVPSSAI